MIASSLYYLTNGDRDRPRDIEEPEHILCVICKSTLIRSRSVPPLAQVSGWDSGHNPFCIGQKPKAVPPSKSPL